MQGSGRRLNIPYRLRLGSSESHLHAPYVSVDAPSSGQLATGLPAAFVTPTSPAKNCPYRRSNRKLRKPNRKLHKPSEAKPTNEPRELNKTFPLSPPLKQKTARGGPKENSESRVQQKTTQAQCEAPTVYRARSIMHFPCHRHINKKMRKANRRPRRQNPP
jgi:hypothetical protein